MLRYWRQRSTETKGLILGFLGVAGFSLTLPSTRIAVGHLDPVFVGLGRSVVASVFAAALLLATRQALPSKRQMISLLWVVGGVIVGFPLLSAWAMRETSSAHAAVIVAILPLLTATYGALRLGERPSFGFWLSALAGSAIVVMFTLSSSGKFQQADILLFLAAAVGAMGYGEGARLAKAMGGWQVICWALVFAAPFLSIPVVLAAQTHGIDAPWQDWLGFFYVSMISQFLGFFLWYQGLAMGGVARVSQVQLLQPFLTMLAAGLMFGERITLSMFLFAMAVVVTMAIGRQMRVQPAQAKGVIY